MTNKALIIITLSLILFVSCNNKEIIPGDTNSLQTTHNTNKGGYSDKALEKQNKDIDEQKLKQQEAFIE